MEVGCDQQSRWRPSALNSKAASPEPSTSSVFHHLDANKPGLQTAAPREAPTGSCKNSYPTGQKLLFLVVGWQRWPWITSTPKCLEVCTVSTVLPPSLLLLEAVLAAWLWGNSSGAKTCLAHTGFWVQLSASQKSTRKRHCCGSSCFVRVGRV